MVRSLVMIGGGVVLSAGLGLYGTSAHAQAAKPNADQQLNQLRQQVAELEHRVTELEKNKGGGVIKQEVAAASAKAPAGTKPGVQDEKPSTTTVRAPFLVQDGAGKTLFRVDVSPGSNRALVEIGDAKGARVHLGQNSGGGAGIALYDSTNTAGVYMTNTPTKNYVSVVTGERASTILAETSSSSAIVYNGKGVPAATLQAGEPGAGRLQISGPAGDVLIDLGVTADNVGWVRTSGPGGGGISTTPGVPHSWIRGWKK